MGGLGSGRPSRGSSRDTVEARRSLDVNHFSRKGCLRPGGQGSLQWTQNGQPSARIGLRAEVNRIVLTYRYATDGDNWENVEESIPIVRVRCWFGSSRPYFVCPGVVAGVSCGRRVVKLYEGGRYFFCRRCYRLRYASQAEQAWNRALGRASKIRMRLGGEPSLVSPFPERPKNMWWRTYDRLRRRTLLAEGLANAWLLAALTRRSSGKNRITRKSRP